MAGLPEHLKSAEAFYDFLGVGSNEQKFLESYSRYRYRLVAIPKRRGGTRVLLVPDKRLKFLQRKTLILLDKIHSPRAPVHGFVKSRSAVTNANQHQSRPYLLNVDLRDFFGSISWRRIEGVLEAVGLSAEVARAVCAICIPGNQLPQGAPTSPILSNMVTYRLDTTLMQFAKANRLRYTRYADDLSFSSFMQPTALFEGAQLPASGKISQHNLSTPLRFAIAQNGFAINPEKVWFSGLRGRKEVTGLVVNEFTNVKRGFLRNIRAALYKIDSLGVAAAEKDYRARYKTEASLKQVLRGRLEWVAQVRGRSFSAYRTLAKRFNHSFPGSELPIHPTYEEIALSAVWVVEYFADGGLCHQGTAFFLDDVGLVTAYHVLKDLPAGQHADVYRPSAPTKKFKATPSLSSVDRDLVVLEHDVPGADRLALQAATSPDRRNTEVLALGFPDFGPGDQLSTRPGNIVARSTKHGVKLIEISASLPAGISGGPVVNDRYQVVGVAHKGGAGEHKQLAIDVAELLALSKHS